MKVRGFGICGETMLVLKTKYRSMLKKILSTGDKFELALAQYDGQLEALVHAKGEIAAAKKRLESAGAADRAAIFDEKMSQLEQQAVELYKKRQEVASKKDEYVARIEAAVAMKEATKSLRSLSGMGVLDIGDVCRECDAELARIEAETETLLKLS